MLHLFRRNGTQDGTPIERGDGSVVVTHILTKFLKRLHHAEKPRLLDLGRLSGSNIEFFAQRGCRVQVEDLLLALETEEPSAPGAGDDGPAPVSTAANDREAPGGIVAATDALVLPELTGRGDSAPGAAPPRPTPGETRRPAADPSAVALRPGARPSRRIVLPPRTFASQASRAGGSPEETRPRPRQPAAIAPRNDLLPTRFAYPDETFDALVAWDIFNYYDPGAMTLLAAEARRILKPGGLLLGYFHARRPEGPETPRRFRILDEGRVACDRQPGPPLRRHVYQNRDIEKMFMGLSIVELYFLKNATRELLMEKKTLRPPAARSLVRPAVPRPKFTIE
jgi:SAM-dependent methyltransferase